MLVHGEGKLADEMLDQQRNVFAALAQRRELNSKHIQPVKKIGAEGALFDHFFEIFVSRGNAPEIDLDNLIAADARDLALLQHAQQIGLSLQADIADFVEKYRAAFGDFKFSLLAILRPGERAFFVTKEFAFEQRLGERAAVNDDQGMEAAHAGGVNGSYHQLFARSRSRR